MDTFDSKATFIKNTLLRAIGRSCFSKQKTKLIKSAYSSLDNLTVDLTIDEIILIAEEHLFEVLTLLTTHPDNSTLLNHIKNLVMEWLKTNTPNDFEINLLDTILRHTPMHGTSLGIYEKTMLLKIITEQFTSLFSSTSRCPQFSYVKHTSPSEINKKAA